MEQQRELTCEGGKDKAGIQGYQGWEWKSACEPGWDSVGTISADGGGLAHDAQKGASEREAIDVAGRRNVHSESADEVKGPRVKAEGDPQQRTLRCGAVVLYWTCRVRAEVDVAHHCQLESRRWTRVEKRKEGER